jgi:F0F1-type ATP synthase assembly protein I
MLHLAQLASIPSPPLALYAGAVALMPFNRPIPDPSPRRKSSSGLETLVQAEKLMQIAILLPSAAFVGWLLGAWADKAWHQSWIGLAGMVFGGISGIVYVVRLVLSTGADTQIGNNDTKQ